MYRRQRRILVFSIRWELRESVVGVNRSMNREEIQSGVAMDKEWRNITVLQLGWYREHLVPKWMRCFFMFYERLGGKDVR